MRFSIASVKMPHNGKVRTRRVGERALLVECADSVEVRAAYAALRADAGRFGAVDIVPAARTVLLDGLDDVALAESLVAALPPGLDAGTSAEPRPVGRLVEIPVVYDGPDLAEVGRQWGVEVGEVVRIHQRTEFVVAFCGFAPGFGYCEGLPADRQVRRRDEPRARVPAGGVGLAGPYSCVYPSASPGGWQLIGTTHTRVWRPEHERPALLEPGTRVRFVHA